MGEQRDDEGQPSRGRGRGYTARAGFGPQGEHPRMMPPRTPPQWQQGAPPRQDGSRPAPQQYPQPGFTPAGPQPGRQPYVPRRPDDPPGDEWGTSAGGSWQPSPNPYPPRQPNPPQPQYPRQERLAPAFQPGYQGQPQPPRGHYPPPQPYEPQPRYPPQYAPRPQQYAPAPRRPSWVSQHKGLTVFLSLCGLVFIIGIAAAAGSGSPSSPSAGSAAGAQTQAAAPAARGASQAPAQTPSSTSPAGTTSEMQALAAAQDYLSDGQGFSRQGLIGQLDSSMGDGFSVADATWAVDHSGANWDDQAVDCAKEYMSDGQGFSRQGLIEQMTSAEGDQFTQAQAEYAANAVGL